MIYNRLVLIISFIYILAFSWNSQESQAGLPEILTSPQPLSVPCDSYRYNFTMVFESTPNSGQSTLRTHVGTVSVHGENVLSIAEISAEGGDSVSVCLYLRNSSFVFGHETFPDNPWMAESLNGWPLDPNEATDPQAAVRRRCDPMIFSYTRGTGPYFDQAAPDYTFSSLLRSMFPGGMEQLLQSGTISFHESDADDGRTLSIEFDDEDVFRLSLNQSDLVENAVLQGGGFNQSHEIEYDTISGMTIPVGILIVSTNSNGSGTIKIEVTDFQCSPNFPGDFFSMENLGVSLSSVPLLAVTAGQDQKYFSHGQEISSDDWRNIRDDFLEDAPAIPGLPDNVDLDRRLSDRMNMEVRKEWPLSRTLILLGSFLAIVGIVMKVISNNRKV